MENKKINVLQYLPYFPPHVWGLETHAFERAKYRSQLWYWCSYVATYAINQKDQYVYMIDWIKVFCIPAYDIIPWFPMPKFWKKEYWSIHNELAKLDCDIIITRTRFFLSSFLGWVYAHLWWMKRIHIEHGVGSVRMNRKRKEYIAWCYDYVFGRYIFHAADMVIGISMWCRRFVQCFTKRDIPVIYRGVDFSPKEKSKNKRTDIFLWYVWRLTTLKGVDTILYACALLMQQNLPVRHLEIVWDWEERNVLEAICRELWLEDNVTFLWHKDKNFLENTFYPNKDICLNASWQEGLPTSVIESLLSGCVVLATAVGGTSEISDKQDLVLIKPGDPNLYAESLIYLMWKYKDLSWLSYETVRYRFDWSRSIMLYSDIFSVYFR